MKKLIVAAAIVCAAALSQAATFKWNVEDIMDPSNPSAYAGSALVCFIESATTSLADATKSLGEGNTSFLSGAKWQTSEVEDGFAEMAKLGSYSGNDVVTGYLVILDSDSIGGAKNYIITDELSKTFPANGGNASMAFGSQASVAWTSLSSTPGPDPVPEPTSGLMLLLGMAGLALKRKRA